MSETAAPTVEEWLAETGTSEAELAELVGVKGVHAIRSLRKRTIPKSWAEKMGVVLPEETREREHTPRAPSGATVQAPPSGLDYSSVAGHIEGAYKLAGFALADSDPVLSAVVIEHAGSAGQAWTKWIESEPRVAALLERMMIGTPLGEVIAVHVGIGFAYFLARGAHARAREELRRREQPEEPEPDPGNTFVGPNGPEPRPAFAGS